MAGLFVPLDVNYADDDKIIAAGPMGELLYVRSLTFAKRACKDGLILDSQLSIVGARIPRARHVSERLVELGLWERNGAGIYVSAWLKHNTLVAETSTAKSAAGTLGNHRRWHVPPKGTPSEECPHCRKEGLT